jgi:hypothetical protein
MTFFFSLAEQLIINHFLLCSDHAVLRNATTGVEYYFPCDKWFDRSEGLSFRIILFSTVFVCVLLLTKKNSMFRRRKD